MGTAERMAQNIKKFAAPNTPIFYQEYRQLESEAEALGDVASELTQLTEAVQLSKKNISERTSAVERNVHKQEKRTRELENRQTNPLLKTPVLQPHLWFNGGVEGRIQRQKAKLAQEQLDEPKLRAQMQEAKEELGPLNDKHIDASDRLARKQAMQAKLEKMFEEAVEMFPSQHLAEISISVKDTEKTVAQTELIIKSLQQCIADVVKAQKHYKTALTAVTNAQAMDTKAANDYSRRGQMPQRMLNRRDRDMNTATAEIQQASQHLEHAISSIPIALRESYPQSIAEITQYDSQRNSPTNAIAHVGASAMRWVAGISERIAKETRLAKTGAQYAAHCEAMLQSLLNQSQLDAQTSRTKLVDLQNMLKAEKIAIFHSIEASMLAAGPQAGMHVQNGILVTTDEAPASTSQSFDTACSKIDTDTHQPASSELGSEHVLAKEEEDELLRRAGLIVQAHVRMAASNSGDQAVDAAVAVEECTGLPISYEKVEEEVEKVDDGFNVPSVPATAIAPTAPIALVASSATKHGQDHQSMVSAGA